MWELLTDCEQVSYLIQFGRFLLNVWVNIPLEELGELKEMILNLIITYDIKDCGGFEQIAGHPKVF